MRTVNLKFCDIKEKLPDRILKRLQKTFGDVNLYPRNYGELEARLARKHGIKRGNILLVNGVDGGIDLISRIFGRKTLVFTPTYFEFCNAPERNGMKIKKVWSFDGERFRIKPPERELAKSSLVLLCNPNMPFGMLEREQVASVAGRTKGVVALDETYIDFAGRSSIPLIRRHPNLLVLRSFSKAYSMAGIRVGYMVGKEKLLNRIREVIGPGIYPVSSVSVNAALIALDEEVYFRTMRKKVIGIKNGFEGFLRESGFRTIESMTNAAVIKFSSARKSDRFVGYLEKNGVLVNQGDGVCTCGLDRTFVRFACGTRDEMEYAKRVIKRYVGACG